MYVLQFFIYVLSGKWNTIICTYCRMVIVHEAHVLFIHMAYSYVLLKLVMEHAIIGDVCRKNQGVAPFRKIMNTWATSINTTSSRMNPT